MKEIKDKIESAIKENEAHLSKLARSKRLLGQFFPLTSSSLARLEEEQIEHIDQFVYRFTKLLDSMGLRLLPAMYSYLESNPRPRPFLDILDRLEQLEIIDDVSKWQFFRNLRNNLAHDYPESTEQTAETLNILYQEIDSLVSMYKKVRDFWFNRK